MSILGRVVPPLGAMWRAWTGRYRTKGDTATADCLIGFSFGYRGRQQENTPGLSNEDLADVVLRFHDNLPKILQHEIADAYIMQGGRHVDQITRISEPRAAKYTYMTAHQLDTVEVAEQAKLIMDRHNWKTAVLIAQPNHMPRVQAVCVRAGIDWVADADERGAVEFDLRSSQRWTRSLQIWRLYEPLALGYYRLRGWL